MKKIVLIYIVASVVVFIASCFTLNNKMQMQNTSKTKSTVACVLQEAVCHDGCWFLQNKPAVFDESASEIMAAIFRGEVNAPIAAYAEMVDNCFVIHLD